MKNFIIIGGNQGIGQGIAQLLSKQEDNNIIVTSRSYGEQLIVSERLWKIKCDINSESSVQNFHEQVQGKMQRIDGLINCAGVLHTGNYQPEKTIAALNSHQLLDNYQVNAMGHLLLLKKMEKIIAAADKPIVTSISARIGSIKDNQLGGWYSYRMSKAALNMGFKTLEIEWKRKYPHIKLLLIHPGTTDTKLSKPFQQRIKASQLHSVDKTSELIIHQINKKLNGQLTSLFVDFNGIPIEW